MGLRIGEFPEVENQFLTTPIVAESAFDKEDIKKIIDIIDSEAVPKKDITVGSDAEQPDAKFKISFIPYNDENAWVYGKLYDLALEANEQTYKFENVDMFEHIVYMELNESDYIHFHLDIGNEFPQNSRKITAVVNLNNSDDYRGGQFNVKSTDGVTLSRSIGDASFFPAYLQNDVEVVNSGVKKILVAWFGGEAFK